MADVSSNRVPSIRSCVQSAIGSAVIQERQTCAMVYSSSPESVSTEFDASKSPRPCGESLGEVAAHTGPVGRDEGLHPELFEHLEDQASSRSPSGRSSACTSGSLCRNRSAIPSAAPRSVGG